MGVPVILNCGKMVLTLSPVQLALVLALAFVAASQADDVVEEAVGGREVGDDRVERDVAEGRLLGSVRTTTLWAISVSTSTQFLSCRSGIDTAVCDGRRKRRRSVNIEYMRDNNDADISGSIDSHQKREVQELEADRSGKLYGFTVWTAVTQSTTVTVLTTNTDTTVRLSFYCSAALADVPAISCG